MVRRAASTSTDNSQNGSSSVPTRSQRVKRMRLSQPNESDDEEAEVLQQTQGGVYDDDGEEEQVDGDDAEAEGSSKGRKRARANTQGDASGSNYKGKAKAEHKTLPRGADGYIPGSIVRVRLRNFVTYDSVEFSPGPYLNMILGPNGTGKSSIACAICIGLNYPTSVLGRQSEISSFVKLGKDDGHIEIELKGPKGKPNLIVKRTLNARAKNSHFTINGKSASGRDVNQRMEELNVQVTNLCSFLPQDKVAEFAGMTRPQLLRETQRAAGNANLTNWHDTLIESGKELKVMQEKVDGDKSRLTNDQQRNANLERDVKLYEERQQLEREIEFLALVLPFKEYIEARRVYDQSRVVQRQLHAEVDKLKKKNAPYIQLQDNFKTQFEDITRRRDDLKTSSRSKFAIMRKRWDEGDTLDQEAENYKNRLENLRQIEKDRHKKINEMKDKVVRYQKEADNPPDISELEAIKQELTATRAAGQAIQERQRVLQDKQKEVVNQETGLKGTIDEHNRRLKQLEDVSHRKLQALIQWDKDCGDTVAWLRQNRHRFKMEVFEPAMLSITIPNQSFSASVEACFGANDLKTFVAQCEEDYQLLNRLVADTPEALGRKARINTWFRTQGRNQQPPVSVEELNRLGFDGYAMDYIDCPDGMRWWLQSAVGLHRTAIALDPRRVNQTEAMEVLSRNGSINYIVGKIMNSVRRSKYGQRLAQNSTREISPARNLATSSVDPQVKRQHERAIAEAQDGLGMCKAEMDKLSEEDNEIRAESRDAKKRHEEATARRDRIIALQKAHGKAKIALENCQAELERLLHAPSVDDERAQLKRKILQLAHKRGNILKEYQKLMAAAMKEQVQCTRAGLEYLHVGARKTAVDALCKEQQQELNEAMSRYAVADQKYKAAKEDAKNKLNFSRAKLDEVSQATRDRFQELEEAGNLENEPRTAEEIETELGALQTQLDMNMHTNAGVVEQYRQRQIEIAQLSQNIEELEEKMGKVQDRIKRTRDLWEPALMQLVDDIGARFSSAFDRIGCAGEVRVAQHDDFDKWSIEIYVKFRDHERLQLLSAERQSGGERSLTTILYLMSLTAHAKAPFSLVDEINQGMDAKYERTAHNSLVDVTCEEDCGQYFLITPKLLPNLHYHDRMKVLCVNNGEWLPDNNPSGSLMTMIDTYVQHRNGGGSA
ncbi:P-loop containing nucleoside triphosphate hydrolase protein [Trametopsis cervina]|nr:P-loop containing nucleoside triphosphate hydrolase protein [Trametopsis cervina]